MLNCYKSIWLFHLLDVCQYSLEPKKKVLILQFQVISINKNCMCFVHKFDCNIQKYRIKYRGKKRLFLIFINAVNANFVTLLSLLFIDNEKNVQQLYLNLFPYSDRKVVESHLIE